MWFSCDSSTGPPKGNLIWTVFCCGWGLGSVLSHPNLGLMILYSISLSPIDMPPQSYEEEDELTLPTIPKLILKRLSLNLYSSQFIDRQVGIELQRNTILRYLFSLSGQSVTSHTGPFLRSTPLYGCCFPRKDIEKCIHYRSLIKKFTAWQIKSEPSTAVSRRRNGMVFWRFSA